MAEELCLVFILQNLTGFVVLVLELLKRNEQSVRRHHTLHLGDLSVSCWREELEAHALVNDGVFLVGLELRNALLGSWVNE